MVAFENSSDGVDNMIGGNNKSAGTFVTRF